MSEALEKKILALQKAINDQSNQFSNLANTETNLTKALADTQAKLDAALTVLSAAGGTSTGSVPAAPVDLGPLTDLVNDTLAALKALATDVADIKANVDVPPEDEDAAPTDTTLKGEKAAG